jgi:hypothetical protein
MIVPPLHTEGPPTPARGQAAEDQTFPTFAAFLSRTRGLGNPHGGPRHGR